ncbi:hypothetical protein [Streptosporangium sp. NPDC006930]|uniref:hypothetical protein n=2 Tax=Streptosporangium TaxID=2000 RepID=UPI0034172C16
MGTEPDAFVFLGKREGFLRGNNFRREARWTDALKELGVKGLHYDSDRAAPIYQRATRDADQRVADALSARVEAEQKNDDGGTVQKSQWPVDGPNAAHQDRLRGVLAGGA